mmetsp:Transcript_23212/g.62922  ORF Transcript_23212/g.62922 Transcript_23212/m.62922 type:complete len:206 (+) Transcript_23212:1089-1706(+)
MRPLPPSRPSAPSSLSTGAPLASSAASTTSPPPWCLAAISPRSCARSPWRPTPLPSPSSTRASTTSSISCTPSVPLCTGTWVRAWRRASSPRPVRILPPSRRTTRRSAPSPLRARARRRARSTRCFRPLCGVAIVLAGTRSGSTESSACHSLVQRRARSALHGPTPVSLRQLHPHRCDPNQLRYIACERGRSELSCTIFSAVWVL